MYIQYTGSPFSQLHKLVKCLEKKTTTTKRNKKKNKSNNKKQQQQQKKKQLEGVINLFSKPLLLII